MLRIVGKRLYEEVIYWVRCHLVQLEADYINIVIQPYQSYCS